MAQANSDFSDQYSLHKLIKLRKRKFFTASDTLRLRYVILNAGLVLIAAYHVIPNFSSKTIIDNNADNVSYEVVSTVDHQAQGGGSADTSYDTAAIIQTESEPESETVKDAEQNDKRVGSAVLPVASKQGFYQRDVETARSDREDTQSEFYKKDKGVKPAPGLTPAPFVDEPWDAASAVQKRDQDANRIEPASGQASKPFRASGNDEGFSEYHAPSNHMGFDNPPEYSDQIKHYEVGSGDTIGKILERAGLSGVDAHYAIKAMSKRYDPRKVRPGQDVKVTLSPKRGQGHEKKADFKSFAVKISPIKELTITKLEDEKFVANVTEEKLVKRTASIATTIETSLYGSALRAGIPQSVVAEIIRLYSWSVDFQRDIRSGDKIEIFFETMENKDGSYKEFGNVLYANLGVGGKDKPIYRYKMFDGDTDYFEPSGRSIRKTLMRTPIDGARLSSGFGMRRHPVLGYNKMHKGVDFAAPTGTPIYAAGDGTIDMLGKRGGYGNYIRIRHNSKLKTAYAHLHKYKKGLRKGSRVKQGQVIGYVGSTGRSTGPHLHYEVLLNGVQKNPRSVSVPTGEELKGKAMAKFKKHMASMDQRYLAHKNGDSAVKVAQTKR